MKYQVECHLPGGTEAELNAAFSSFDEAFFWLDQRLKENDKRIRRFFYDGGFSSGEAGIDCCPVTTFRTPSGRTANSEAGDSEGRKPQLALGLGCS